MKSKLIVALDVDTEAKALDLAKGLKGAAEIFKVGSVLFASCGPDIIGKIKGLGAVFLDLKFHDIPNTVAASVRAATRLGADIVNVHALGGEEMMRAASSAGRDEAKALGIARPKVIAVTMLTSTDKDGLKKIGIRDTIEKQLLILARLARASGLDGVVASGREVKLLRKEFGKDFLIVTPGVRPAWAAKADQKRVATPKEAIEDGADYIVVGRPIIESDDPLKAAEKILEEIGG